MTSMLTDVNDDVNIDVNGNVANLYHYQVNYLESINNLDNVKMRCNATKTLSTKTTAITTTTSRGEEVE